MEGQFIASAIACQDVLKYVGRAMFTSGLRVYISVILGQIVDNLPGTEFFPLYLDRPW